MTAAEHRRVLVCGDREWHDDEMIRGFVASLPLDSLVIHGACRGADEMAGIAASNRGMPVVVVPAHWHVFGVRAGPVRNAWMLEYLAPTEVHGFHDKIESSKGTKDMRARCERLGIPFQVHSHEGSPAPRGGRCFQ